MTDKKDYAWVFTILIVLVTFVILKGGIPAYLKYAHKQTFKSEVIRSISISTNQNANELSLTVENKSQSYIKDLVIECTFITQSGTILGEVESTLYKVFPKNRTHKISDFVGLDVPDQTNLVDCVAKDMTILSKEDIKKFSTKIINEVFNVSPNQ